ncbi:MAG: hypothetical protein QY320_02305 [Gammaproteobacteria bacterium]|nr:MAG: hypothetical protein QY320_02305 [Gammaproteobacteria bacterium]
MGFHARRIMPRLIEAGMKNAVHLWRCPHGHQKRIDAILMR